VGIKVCRILCHRYGCKADKIGIITFYAGQVERFARALKEEHLPKIEVNTVDGYQGREKDIIILSFVRANHRHNIGFVRECRRLNVALTRARHSLILLGNRRTLEGEEETSRLIADLEKRGLIFPVPALPVILNGTNGSKRKRETEQKEKTEDSLVIATHANGRREVRKRTRRCEDERG